MYNSDYEYNVSEASNSPGGLQFGGSVPRTPVLDGCSRGFPVRETSFLSAAPSVSAGPELFSNQSLASSAWTPARTDTHQHWPDSSNLFGDHGGGEEYDEEEGDGQFYGAFQDYDTSNSAARSSPSAEVGPKRRRDKSVTFNNEDIFNIYDENINSTFDLVGPPSQSQLIPGSQVRLGSSSQLSPTARKISSSQCIKKTAEGIFKLPETPNNNLRSRTGSGSLDPLKSRSHSHLDAELTSKLLSFSEKLKSLTDPGTPLTSEKMTTPRLGSGMVTPRNKTPESGARHGSVSSRGDTNLPDPSCFAAVYEGTGSAAGEVGVAAMFLETLILICQF